MGLNDSTDADERGYDGNRNGIRTENGIYGADCCASCSLMSAETQMIRFTERMRYVPGKGSTEATADMIRTEGIWVF